MSIFYSAKLHVSKYARLLGYFVFRAVIWHGQVMSDTEVLPAFRNTIVLPIYQPCDASFFFAHAKYPTPYA